MLYEAILGDITKYSYSDRQHTLLNIKVLHDATEEPFCLNGSIKNFIIWRIFLFHKRIYVRWEMIL